MSNIKEKLEKDYLHVRIILEVVGKPKEHVEETIRGYIDKIKEEQKEIEIMNEHIEKAVKQEDSEMFSTFAEFEALFKDIKTLTSFCFYYMPSSVEIIEPHVMKLKDSDLSAIFSDLQGKLHAMDMAIKQAKFENTFLSKNFGNLLKNMVLITLVGREMAVADISKATGVQEKELLSVIEELVKDNKVKKVEDKFSLVS